MTQFVPRGVLAGIRRIAAALLLLAGVAGGDAAVAQSATDARELDARVERALNYTSERLMAKIRNMSVAFNWIGTSDRFWFRKQAEDGGAVFILVNAATGAQSPLFDAKALDAALRTAGATPGGVINSLFVTDDARAMVVGVSSADAACRWPAAPVCRKPATYFDCDLPAASCRAANNPPRAGELYSPDRKTILFTRAHNLWARDVASGSERQLTRDGAEHFAYGRTHNQHDFNRVERRRAGLPYPMVGVLWSPDGRYVLTVRHDQRALRDAPVVTEYIQPEGKRPYVHNDRMSLAADRTYPPATLNVIDLASGRVVAADADPTIFSDYSVNFYFNRGHLRWSNGGDVAWLYGLPRGGREMRLLRMDLASAKVREVIVEKGNGPVTGNDFAVRGPSMSVSPDGTEIVWFSHRDGWGHLYLYDAATGRVKRQITKGNWVVTDVVHVDHAARTIYFAAVGREPGQNVYYRHLYAVGMDGGQPKLLTPEVADHTFANDATFFGGGGSSMSASGRYMIDAFSSYAQPDTVNLRDRDGRLIANVVNADITELRKLGWRPPEPFVVKAADGVTDLYGILYKPMNFDRSKKYPVIEITYPPPAGKFTPTTFYEDFSSTTTLNAHALAEVGTVVVAMDGRGGAFRSVKFRETFIGTDDYMGSADHVAAIRNLGVKHAYLDLDRVGITGHSNGGYASLRAILLHPDFFKVAVSGEGPGDMLVASVDAATERVLGVPITPDVLAYYRRISNEAVAHRLKGKLLLIFGGADEGVPLQNAFQLFHAFEKANKVYDSLILPDSPHFGGREPYGVMRTVRYFAEHLGGPR